MSLAKKAFKNYISSWLFQRCYPEPVPTSAGLQAPSMILGRQFPFLRQREDQCHQLRSLTSLPRMSTLLCAFAHHLFSFSFSKPTAPSLILFSLSPPMLLPPPPLPSPSPLLHQPPFSWGNLTPVLEAPSLGLQQCQAFSKLSEGRKLLSLPNTLTHDPTVAVPLPYPTLDPCKQAYRPAPASNCYCKPTLLGWI